MLTILLPVNRYDEYFDAALVSIQGAIEKFDYSNELLVVINNSTKKEKEMILKSVSNYRYTKRIVVSHAADLAAILNIGIEKAKFNLIARVDSDDINYPERFRDQFIFLAQNPEVALVGGQIDLIGKSETIIGKAHYPISSKSIKKELCYGNCFAHPAVMYRREAVESVGGYRSNFTYAEDYDLWVRLAEKYKLCNLRQTVIKYRIHEDQVSTTNLLEQIKSTVKIMAFGFNLDQLELEKNLESLVANKVKTLVEKILNLEQVKKSRKFKAAIALLVIKRRSRVTQISFKQKIYLLLIVLKNDPLRMIQSIIQALLTRIY